MKKKQLEDQKAFLLDYLSGVARCQTIPLLYARHKMFDLRSKESFSFKDKENRVKKCLYLLEDFWQSIFSSSPVHVRNCRYFLNIWEK